MRFEVLGPVRVGRDSDQDSFRDFDVVPVSGRLRRALLALLCARANTPVPTDTIAAALWGEDLRGGGRLQLLVHNLRKALGAPERVEFESGCYRLRVLPGELDADRFAALVTEARSTADPERRVDLLRVGLGLWRGRPYQDLDLTELASEVQRLAELRLDVLEELFTAELSRGRDAAVVAELTELTEQHPLRERLHALLMTALYRAGRQADALAAYQRARHTLVDELGLEPGPELRELERRILAGEVVGEPVATGVIRPAQLPHTLHDFVGRDRELAELDRLAGAAESPRVVVVAGTAGVGKTALVTRWAHGARTRFPDGQLYVDLRGYGPDQPLPAADALAGFLRALGVDRTAVPQDLTERAARFRTLLDRRRILVVLDNAATVDQVRPLLPGAPSCLVLVTSRDALAGLAARDGAHRIQLDRMTAGEASDLLAERLGHRPADDASAAATARLIERCARLPLALCILAERLGERRGTSIVDLDEELADESHRLDLLDTGDPHTSVRAVFSWSYHQLPAAAARLFRLFGLRTGHDVDLHAVAALAGADDLREIGLLLDTLVRAHLVDRTETGRYQQHDLLWAYTAELAHATEDDRDAALTRLLDHFRYTASVAVNSVYPDGADARPRVPEPPGAAPDLSDPAAAEAWLDANYTNLLAAAEYAGDHGWPAHTGDISATLARHIRRRAHHSHAHQLHGRALTIARTLGDRAGEQAALAGLAHTFRMTGRYAEATEHYREALEIASDLGDRHGELTALGGLGDTYFTAGHHALATERYRRLLTVARAAGYRLGELKALAGFGHADMWSGRYAEGEDYYRQAHAIALELGNRASELTAILGLGHVHMLTGRYERSADYRRQGLAIAREVGHRLAELSALTGFGELAARAGRHEEAVDRFTQALAMARAIGVRSNENLLLIELGHVHRATGRLESAAEHFERALAGASESGHQIGLIGALDGLGRTRLATGDPHAALTHHRDARTRAEDLDLPRELADAHDGLGHAHHALDNPERARHHWHRALDLRQRLGVPEAEHVRHRLDTLSTIGT